MLQIIAITNFFSVLKSPTQLGVDGVINLKPNISSFGPFNLSSLCVAGRDLPMSAYWRVGQNPTKGTIAWFLSVLFYETNIKKQERVMLIFKTFSV